MFGVVLRSSFVGVASVVFGLPLLGFASLIILGILSSTGQADSRPVVGWDLVALARNHPVLFISVPLAVFTIGFSIAYRFFSGSLVQK